MNQKKKAYIWIPMLDGQPAYKLEVSRKELARILKIRRAGRKNRDK